jgi:hypothetical protein
MLIKKTLHSLVLCGQLLRRFPFILGAEGTPLEVSSIGARNIRWYANLMVVGTVPE